MVNRSLRPASQEGTRPFPAASLEITLLEEAQLRAKTRELELFGQLCRIFDWQLTRRQRRYYLKSLSDGLTLVLTDLSKTILWTSRSFLSLTGYTNGEVLGQTPGLLQGQGTSERVMREANERLKRSKSVEVQVKNYRKNGEPYQCRVAIDPMRNGQGDMTHYLAVEQELK
ncbi:MAG: PAS domain-containing protein [Cytophagales bacterium]|nr:MAG: PAS domain-containing protein [Cytophagales bacterium]